MKLLLPLMLVAFTASAQIIRLPSGVQTNEASALKVATGLMKGESAAAKSRGLEFMTTLARAGSAEAAYQLGEFYHVQGQPKNEPVVKELEFYLMAARKGHVLAQRTLARYYGEHHQPNNERYWYLQAAKGGDDYSKNVEAGYLYKDGNVAQAWAIWEKNANFRGLASCCPKAVDKYKWIRVAQLSGQDTGKELDKQILSMPRAEVDQAEASAVAYYTKRYAAKP